MAQLQGDQSFPVSGTPSDAQQAGRLGRLLKEINENRLAYMFLAPATLLMALFIAYPLYQGLVLAFFEWNGLSPREFVNILNFEILISDTTFYKSLWNNFQFSLFSTIGTTVIGFSIAYTIERRIRGWMVFKVVYFLPVMMSGTVVGLLWGLLLDPTFGPINAVLGVFGIAGPEWLGNPKLALYTVIAVNVWQFSGFSMIIFLSAMEAIPTDIHEAATLDGVGWWKRLRFIILPLTKSVFAVWTMLQIIFSFKIFDLIFAMTGGGPGDATNVLGIMLYRTAFRFTEFGYGSAVAVVMTVIIMFFTLIYLRFVRFEQYY
jgi:ABC-type sugar transport system permease subunit